MRITLPQEKYRGAAINEFFQELLERLGRRPACAPRRWRRSFLRRAFLDGVPPDSMATDGETMPKSQITAASASTSRRSACRSSPDGHSRIADRRDAPLVAIVNQAFVVEVPAGAERAGPPRVDRALPDRPSPPMEIVGVVANTQNRDMRNSAVAGDLRAAAPADAEQSAVPAGPDHRRAGGMLPVVRQQIAADRSGSAGLRVQTMEDGVSPPRASGSGSR